MLTITAVTWISAIKSTKGFFQQLVASTIVSLLLICLTLIYCHKGNNDETVFCFALPRFFLMLMCCWQTLMELGSILTTINFFSTK